ncbi:MAG: magnesium transporter [Gammaproteobacteria bacterium]|nr:magnesium transporter [Gammaproteobacteria bacterium]MCW9059943.1 magnesium transporter [Gammaproteobacteria bacterium]
MGATAQDTEQQLEQTNGIAALLAVIDQAALDGWLAERANQDVAAALDSLDDQATLVLLRRLPLERMPHIFSHLATEHQARLLERLSSEEKAYLVGELSYDDAAALIDELEEPHSEEIIELLEPQDRQVIETLLSYPDDSVGRLMTPEYIALRPGWTVNRALEYVRRHSEEGETINDVFVTDREGHLLGMVGLKHLLLSRPASKIESLLGDEVVSIDVNAHREDAAHLTRRYDIETLPVVNSEKQLLGVVTVDDVFDMMEEESTEDFHKLGSVAPLALSLMEASPSLLYRKRVGWLVILILVNIVSGGAIAFYEAAIETVVALVFFLPLVIASGGNAGAQSATLMVRALATGDVQAKDWLRLWGKEFSVSMALGLTMGASVWWAGNWVGGSGVGNTIALAMLLVVLFGSMLGMIMPFLLARLKIDPATASAPLITSIADVVGILIYFSVALMVLGI